MTEKKIQIAGREFAIVFNMQTILNFEDMSPRSFFGNDMHMLIDKIYLVVAAIIAANEKEEINADEIKQSGVEGIQQIVAAYDEVMKMAAVFFKIPAVEQKNEPEAPEDEDEQPKNE